GARVGGGVAVTGDHAHVVDRHAEALGRDLREAGVHAAHVDGADDDADGAVAIEAARGVGGLDAAHPAAHGHADTDALAVARSNTRAVLPLLLQSLQALAKPHLGPRLARDHRITGSG